MSQELVGTGLIRKNSETRPNSGGRRWTTRRASPQNRVPKRHGSTRLDRSLKLQPKPPATDRFQSKSDDGSAATARQMSWQGAPTRRFPHRRSAAGAVQRVNAGPIQRAGAYWAIAAFITEPYITFCSSPLMSKRSTSSTIARPSVGSTHITAHRGDRSCRASSKPITAGTSCR